MKSSQLGFNLTDSQETPSEEPHVLSPSELNQAIRKTLETGFPLLWIRGEISNFKAHTSGHFYFSLKDEKSQINAVMFKGFNSRLKFRPADGMEVLIRARVTVYEPRGNYQIFCELMDPVGAGALQMAFEQLKKKLETEGLFDPRRKRKLPAIPSHLALITSPTGAAVRDMLNVLTRRFRGLHITLVPVLVQGDKAPASLVEGLRMANLLKDLDVIIIGRGGGSLEDLWAFNDETLARAIAASRVPVISAVGHEVDFTISDFVADLRAPTPSAAAELVVKNAADLIHRIKDFEMRLATSMKFILQRAGEGLRHLTARLVDPKRRLQDLAIRCDELTQRLDLSIARALQDLRHRIELAREKMGDPKELLLRQLQRLDGTDQRLSVAIKGLLRERLAELKRLGGLLDSLSPLRVVERGFSIVTLNDQIVKSAAQLRAGSLVRLQFAKGSAEAEIRKLSNQEVKDGF